MQRLRQIPKRRLHSGHYGWGVGVGWETRVRHLMGLITFAQALILRNVSARALSIPPNICVLALALGFQSQGSRCWWDLLPVRATVATPILVLSTLKSCLDHASAASLVSLLPSLPRQSVPLTQQEGACEHLSHTSLLCLEPSYGSI